MSVSVADVCGSEEKVTGKKKRAVFVRMRLAGDTHDRFPGYFLLEFNMNFLNRTFESRAGTHRTGHGTRIEGTNPNGSQPP